MALHLFDVGGRSVRFVRTTLGIGFGGFTDTSKWLVVDIRNDPLGVPNIYMHSDPQRPYVSVALPDGVRRFEFMIFEDETEEHGRVPQEPQAPDDDAGRLTRR